MEGDELSSTQISASSFAFCAFHDRLEAIQIHLLHDRFEAIQTIGLPCNCLSVPQQCILECVKTSHKIQSGLHLG